MKTVAYEITDWESTYNRVARYIEVLCRGQGPHDNRFIHHLAQLKTKLFVLRNGKHKFTSKQVSSLEFANQLANQRRV